MKSVIKKSVFGIIFLTLIFLVPQKILAATVFEDTFTVTGGGGDVNYNYSESGRQTGSATPIDYVWWFSSNG